MFEFWDKFANLFKKKKENKAWVPFLIIAGIILAAGTIAYVTYRIVSKKLIELAAEEEAVNAVENLEADEGETDYFLDEEETD